MRSNSVNNGSGYNQSHQPNAIGQNEAMSMMSNMFNPMMAAFIQQLATQTQSMQSQQSPNGSVPYSAPTMIDSSSTNIGNVPVPSQPQWNHHTHHHQSSIGMNTGFNGNAGQQHHTRYKGDKKF